MPKPRTLETAHILMPLLHSWHFFTLNLTFFLPQTGFVEMFAGGEAGPISSFSHVNEKIRNTGLLQSTLSTLSKKKKKVSIALSLKYKSWSKSCHCCFFCELTASFKVPNIRFLGDDLVTGNDSISALTSSQKKLQNNVKTDNTKTNKAKNTPALHANSS